MRDDLELGARYTKEDAKRDYRIWTGANTAYHNGRSIMSDAEFDRLTRKLKPFYPNIDKKVGAEPMAQHASARKVRLEIPMNSLDKAFANKGDLPAKVKSKIGSAQEVIISEKVDGYSLQYRRDTKGKASLYTRGKDGVGQDVSHLIEPMKKVGILGVIQKGETIRMELVLPKGSLADTDDSDPEVERNAIASIINARTPNFKILKRAVAVALSFMEPHMPPSRAFARLKKAGWRVPRFQTAKPKELTDKFLTALYQSWESRSKYVIDGLVVAANVPEKPSLSNPKHAFAYKVNKSGPKTEVIEIVWQLSRYGDLRPVANIKPVKIDGVTVTRATAHNAQYVKKHKLGPGASIEVIRSGGVIPYIVEVHRSAAKASFPKAGTYEWDGVHIRTLDESHDEEINAKMVQTFFAKLDVAGFGPAVGKLVSDLSIHEIMTLETEDWLDRGAGNSVASKMPAAIKQAMKDASIPKLMAYCGVFGQGFGESSARDLWDVVQNEKPANKNVLAASLGELAGWSMTSAKDVASNWKAWVKWFNALPIKPVKKKAVANGPLKGAVVVFTKIRDAAMAKDIVAKGGSVAENFTKATTHLIYRDGETSVKLQKAKDNGVQVIPYSKARAKLKL